MPPLPDLLRWVSAVLALLLVPGCIYAAFARITWDQRARFIALALIGVVVVGAQLDGLGKPRTWRMPLVVAALLLADAGVGMYLLRRREGRGDDE
jgi:hypothetical protein